MSIDFDSRFSDPNLESLILMDASLRDILKVREIELNRQGLSHIQARVLYLLRSQEDGVTITLISKMLARKVHSISELINRMEYEGLVTKNKVPPGRTIKLQITQQGIALYSSNYSKSLKTIFPALSKVEHDNFDIYLKKLRAKSRELSMMEEIPPFLS